MSPIIISDHDSKIPTLHPSAEERRQIRWLDERAQEAFVEVRLIIWASALDPKLARRTANNLAQTVAAQYHPNNKLIKGWRIKQGNVQARQFPTFKGQPWIAGELGTIAHLVGKDALLSAPQVRMAPARPLPASTEARITEHVQVVAYLLSDDTEADLATQTYDYKGDLPLIIIEDEVDLPTLIYEDEADLPMIIIEDGSVKTSL